MDWGRIPPMASITHVGNRLYATVRSALHVSHDDGRTWELADAPSGQIASLASDGGLLYAGTRGNGLYVLDTDTGAWRQSQPIETAIDVERVASIDGTLYAAAADGVEYASADGLARQSGDATRLRREGARVLLRNGTWLYGGRRTV